jgi:putative hydrolase of the HAD superfamily
MRQNRGVQRDATEPRGATAASRVAVLLDLDGTLLDGSGLPAALRTTGERLARLAPGLDPDRFVAAHTAVWQELWPEVEDEWMLGHGAAAGIERRAWAGALTRCGFDDPALVDAAESIHPESVQAAHRAYPEVPAALADLRAAGWATAIVTNGAGSLQRAKIADAGLDGTTDLVVVSSEVGVAKPTPGIAEHALLELGADPARSWFVGDNLWVDIEVGSRVGLGTVWVNRRQRIRPDTAPAPDLEVADLAGLAERIAAVRTPGRSSTRTG